MDVQIYNEYDRLEAVMVHRPGPEIERLTHENMKDFLFEDVPYLRRMQDEHDAFTSQLRAHGAEVYELTTLLADVLADVSVRSELLRQVCATAGVPAIAEDLSGLKYWALSDLVTLLFAGLTASEYKKASGQRLSPRGSDEHYILSPVPNAYFTRDPAVVVGTAAISSKMHFRRRVRETLMMRAVLEHHPLFRHNDITYGGTDEPTEDRPYTIEGGDVIILSPETVLVGGSERTRSETIKRLAEKAFRFGHIQRLYEISIPTDRAYMHLDTIFTIVDRGKVLWYSSVMEQVRNIHRYEPDGGDGSQTRRVPEERSLREILQSEFGCDVTFIDTAGGKRPFASREQRMDGSNALAIAPSVAITYERNEHTIRALEAHGVTCVRISDSELVRGLGGPRCMTMPLRRCATKGRNSGQG